jgi:hypothetical protein
MKPYVTFGLGISVIGALITLGLFFAGVHNDPEKLQASNAPAGWVSFAVSVLGVTLAIRATRNSAADGGLTYGMGVLTALLVGLVSGVLSALFILVYVNMINPEFLETNYQMALAQAQAKGVPDADLEKAEAVMRWFTGPVFITIWVFVVSTVLSVLIGLIASIFLRRAPVAVPPPPPESAMAC